MALSETRVSLPDGIDRLALCGPEDTIFRKVEDQFGVHVKFGSDVIIVRGSAADVATVGSLMADLIDIVSRGGQPTLDDVRRSIEILRTSKYSPAELRKDVLYSYRGKSIRPKSAGQKQYVDAIRENVITFGIGPAGTGKTYLAMAMALAGLQRKEYSRIVLTRPVVEAGENLGFLPGTLDEKVDPYVRPLYDALFDMTNFEHGNQLIENGTIEIAPLAFMRGRTFNDAFIILDEAQNTTPEQMKMFLTRLGFGSKMIVTGDVTQLDLPHGVSGLRSVRPILEGIEDIAFVDLTSADVARNTLVTRIVKAYDAAEHAVSGQ